MEQWSELVHERQCTLHRLYGTGLPGRSLSYLPTEVIMKTRVMVDPLTRIEGHLRVEAVVEDGAVVEARSGATLYRGFEQILVGRDPLDAVQLTQRFCGVCPTAHAVASSQCLDNALGIMPPDNGRIIRNLIQGANYIQSHILHFYHLVALDFVRGPDFPPFIPRYEADYRLPKATSDEIISHYVEALHIRLKAHEMLCFRARCRIVPLWYREA